MVKDWIRIKLLKLIDESDVSLYRIEKLTKIPKSTLYSISSAEKPSTPDYDTLYKILDVFGVSMTEFFSDLPKGIREEDDEFDIDVDYRIENFQNVLIESTRKANEKQRATIQYLINMVMNDEFKEILMK